MAIFRNKGDVRLSESFIAQLSDALVQGAFEPVGTVLDAVRETELDRWPTARLLHAISLLDRDEHQRAEQALSQLDRLRFNRALTAHWRARVAAARGDDIRAFEALRACEENGYSPAGVALTRWYVSMTLGQWPPIQDIPDDPRDVSLDDQVMARRLARNLIALHRWQPELAFAIGRRRPWDRFLFAEDDDGLCPYRRAGSEPIPLFDAKEQRQREERALEDLASRLAITDPVLVVGAGAGHLIDSLANAPAKAGKSIVQYVLYHELDELGWLLMTRAWADPLQRGMVRFFQDDVSRWESWLRDDPRRLPSRGLFAYAVVDSSAPLQKCLAEIQGLAQTLRNETHARAREWAPYYASPEFAEGWRTGAARRILIQSCRYTTFIHGNLTQTRNALSEAGHEVIFLDEGDDPAHWVGPAAIEQKVASTRPDLFLRVNFLRQESPAKLPPGLPFVTWVQDYCASHVEAGVSDRLLPRDYLTGLTKPGLVDLGYPASHYLVAPVPSSLAVYGAPSNQSRVFQHDLSYVSHQSTPPSRWMEAFRQSPREARERAFVEALFERLSVRSANGQLVHSVVDEFGADWVTSLAGSPWPGWVSLRSIQLTNLFLRHTVLEWLSTSGYDLALYGNGWEEHPTLSRHARGPVETGPPLREIYRSTRINLQLMATGDLHQRLIDGLLAGGFFLMPHHRFHQSVVAPPPGDVDDWMIEELLSSDLATVAEWRQRHGERWDAFVARRGALSARRPLCRGKREEKLLAAIEGEITSSAPLVLPGIEQFQFKNRDDLLRLVDHWLPRDRERENVAAQWRDKGALDRFTTERLTARLLSWIGRRLTRSDPPVAVPAPFRALLDEGNLRHEQISASEESAGARRERWRFHHDERLVVEGELSNDVPSGRWIATNADGGPLLEAHFAQGILEGAWREWRPGGGLRREGIYRQGRREGEWREWHPDGTLAWRGEHRDGRQHGQSVLFYPSGQVNSQAQWSNGELDGAWLAWHPNGVQRFEKYFERGRRTGRWRRWDRRGTLRQEATFVNGALEGPWLKWNRDGQARAGSREPNASSREGS